jgi:hypothetical protein
MIELNEAHKIGDKVVIKYNRDDVKGKEGRIGEIRRQVYKGAPKTYTVDYDHHETTGSRKSIQLQAKHIKGMKEQTELQEKHRVSITLSDPKHPAVSKRKELIQKTVRVNADNEGHAVDSAIAHYRKAGYKIHDHNYIGTIKEDTPMPSFKSFAEHLVEGHYEDAQEHLAKASKALETSDMVSHHAHMADHHDSLSQWHDSKGRSAAAQTHANKAEMHADKYTALARKSSGIKEDSLDEISMATLTSYKKKAGEAASAADKAGDYKKGNKRFSGIINATKKQLGMDVKKHQQEEVAANNVGDGAIAGTKGDAGKKSVMTKKPMKRQTFREFTESIEEGKRGLWANIHAKRKRIKAGSGEKMRSPGSKGAPTNSDFKASNEELSVDEQFDLIEQLVEELALENNIDSDIVWEQLESIDDDELMEYAIDAKGHKSSTGGLTQKGVDAYNAKTGGNLKTAVTTSPSKLKPGSKAANRRKSFCARMGGMPGAMKDEKGEPTRKALALRKWNC